ncbi:GTP pyrophosphokinase [Leucobacter sp. W1153]|uniref:GTP pyrophosphokinase n=1 Tax=unclassified Leucobacter TaxID=2621730 RepID=UPI003F2C41CF
MIESTTGQNGSGAQPRTVHPLTGPIDLSQIDLEALEGRRHVRDSLARFLMPYKFAIDEVMTKLNILQEEFTQTGEYNPIEHVSSRLKEPDNIIEKMQRRGVPLETERVRETITDIAGVRVVCAFVSDVYRVFELLTAHDDVSVFQVKDYIAKPKENGYRSLHVLLEVPVFLSSGPVQTIVEVQIRTIAMDFWASLEHKIYYKYDREVPEALLRGLSDAAEQAGQLDTTMEWLHIAIRGGGRDTLVRRSADAMIGHSLSSAAGRHAAEESA